MRVAYLSTDAGIPVGGTKGASVHVAEICRALAAEGNEVLVLAQSINAGTASPPGVTVEPLPSMGNDASLHARLSFQPELARWLVERLRAFDAELLYERLALHSVAGTVAARSAGIAYLVELNAPLPEEAARYRKLDQPEAATGMESQTLAGADAILAVSSPLAAYAASRGARRVEVVQNAADVDRYPRRRRGNAPPVAVFVGSLRPWHGIDTIARAWRLLNGKAPPLLVVGDGPERRLLDGLAVRITGAIAPARVPELLAEVDIGLAPYASDTPRYFSPLKLFEYLAAGLATVVADLPAACELVDPDSAMVIAAGDAETLADAVATLLNDPVRRHELGDNGRALIEAGHTWRHRARRIIELAHELAPAGAVR